MSIVRASDRLKTILNQPITDLDHVDLINEKGLYQIFEGIHKDRAFFGLYLAHRTLKSGLEDVYVALDKILNILRKRQEECLDISVEGVSLVKFTDRLFIYHVKVGLINL